MLDTSDFFYKNESAEGIVLYFSNMLTLFSYSENYAVSGFFPEFSGFPSNLQILPIFLHRTNSMLLKYVMIFLFSGKLSSFQTFPNFSEFLHVMNGWCTFVRIQVYSAHKVGLNDLSLVQFSVLFSISFICDPFPLEPLWVRVSLDHFPFRGSLNIS